MTASTCGRQAKRQAEHPQHGHQEHVQAVPEQKADGAWLSRLRS
ncbi:hypothetical protein [Streptomyces lydicus]